MCLQALHSPLVIVSFISTLIFTKQVGRLLKPQLPNQMPCLWIWSIASANIGSIWLEVQAPKRPKAQSHISDQFWQRLEALEGLTLFWLSDRSKRLKIQGNADTSSSHARSKVCLNTCEMWNVQAVSVGKLQVQRRKKTEDPMLTRWLLDLSLQTLQEPHSLDLVTM